jgi:PAS domain S-box-containing protein
MLERLIASEPVGLESTEISSALETSIWTLMAAVLLEFAETAFMPAYSFRWLATIVAVYAVCIPALVSTRRGHTRAAGTFMVVGFWAIVTFLCVTAGGLNALAANFYAVIVLFAGLFLGSRAGVVTALACVLTTLAMVIATRAGWLTSLPLPYTPQIRWVSLGILLILMTVLQHIVSKGIGNALRRSAEQLRERTRAEELMRESEQRFRTLAETATDTIITIDRDSRILFANSAAERLFGYSRQELLGQHMTKLMPERFRGTHEQALARYLETGKRHIEWTSTEFTGLHRDGRELSLEVAMGEVRENGVHTFTGIIRDISERKHADETIRSSERRFSVAFNANPTLATISTLEGRFLNVNEQFLQTSGYSRSEVIGRTALEIGMWPNPDNRVRLMQALKERGYVRGFEVELRTKTGEPRMLLLSVERIELEGQPCLLHSGQDITDRTQAEAALRNSEERLRALSARLQYIREEEGKRISRTIHDEMGGALSGLRWDLEGIAESLGTSTNGANAQEVREKIARMMDLIESTLNTVRRISSDLRPPLLDDLGLIAAVEWQLQQFQSRMDIQCHFETTLDKWDLAPDRATAVFRIFQEILTNVLRHAQATHVTVSIFKESDAVVLNVRDNGRGITEGEKSNPRSLGLLGMRERALLFGGEVVIMGTQGKGTTVTVIVPFMAVTAH